MNYDRQSSFTESDATNDSNNNFNYFTTDETLKTSGGGANLKLGVIFKPIESVRLGLSFHSPTWYQLKDVYTAAVTTDLEGYGGSGIKTQSSTDFNNGMAGEFNYYYTTPWRAAFGAAYVFREESDVHQQRGYVSADVEYVNYTASSFRAQSSTDQASTDYFHTLNQKIDGVFKSAVNIRIGGELKFNTIMVRAGYAFYGNPYTANFFNNKTSDIVKANHMNLSAGLGWRDKGIFVDLTAIYRISKDAYYPYRLDQSVFSPASINSNGVNVLATVGFKF